MKSKRLNIIFQIFGFLIFSVGILYLCQFFSVKLNEGFLSSECPYTRLTDGRVIYTCDSQTQAEKILDNIPENLPRYPICYTIGLGYTFQKLLNLTPDFNEYCNRLYNLNYTDKWSTDEFYFAKVIEENKDNFTIKKKQRGYMSNFFITDRINKCNFSDKSLWKIDLDGQINFKLFKDIHFPKFTECDDLIHRVYKNLIKFKTNEC